LLKELDERYKATAVAL